MFLRGRRLHHTERRVAGQGFGWIASTMPTQTAPAHPSRVLALVPASRYTGHAVVDWTGLVTGSFATWNLKPGRDDTEQVRIFLMRLHRSVRRYHPAVLVLGLPRFDDERLHAIRQAAADLARRNSLPVVIRRVDDARQLLIGRMRGDHLDALVDRLARGFFPELAAVRTTGEARRYYRHAFSAVAVALHELVARAPLSAAVLAKDDALTMGRFSAALAESARRHFPDNL